MADFNFARGLPFLEETISNVLISESNSGVEQRRDKWGKTKKKFTINFKVNTKTEIEEIRDFFVARGGRYETFDFTNPIDSTTYTCRFVDESLEIERQGYGVYNCKVQLIEVFS